MIERFNFYDVYGYLLPGLVLSALIAAPLWIAGGLNPPQQLATAGLAVFIGYVVGHFLQRIAEAWLPWISWGVPRAVRLPSNTALDAADTRLTAELKKHLAEKIRTRFGLDVRVDVTGTAHDGVRRDAFFLCRRDLLNSKRAQYAEQFQGMYAMMDGYACAFLLAAAYYSGIAGVMWIAVPPWVERWLFGGLLLWIAILFLKNGALRVWLERTVGLFIFGLVGAEVAWFIGTKPHLAGASFAIALGCAVLARKSAVAYGNYTETFALTVYRDFMVDAPKEKGVTINTE